MTLLAPTLSSAAVTPRPAAPVRWTLVDGDLWVANAGGAFAGTVDPQGRHFFVRDCFARSLGDYPTLTAAQIRLTDHLTDTAA